MFLYANTDTHSTYSTSYGALVRGSDHVVCFILHFSTTCLPTYAAYVPVSNIADVTETDITNIIILIQN